jgi:hypothetical protein
VFFLVSVSELGEKNISINCMNTEDIKFGKIYEGTNF